MAKTKDVYPWEDAFEALVKTMSEELQIVEKVIANEDSSCAARGLRRERAAALQWALSVADNLRRWEW